jgi:spermidine/putrescine transport system permease protein
MVVVFCIIFLPIAVIIFESFNATDYGKFPFQFTFEWYTYLFTKSELFPATFLSLELALSVCVAVIIIGTVTALGLQYLPKKVTGKFNMVAQLPITIPWLVQAISILLLLNFTGLGRSFVGMFFGNLIVVLPYVIMMVAGRFAGADRTPEDAARMLGARPLQVFRDVTLPMLVPGIVSGGLMSFMVCFNAFSMQYFLAPFGVRTLPMEIFTLVRVGYKPDLNALATLLILFTSVIVLLLNKLGYSAKKTFGA